MTAAATNPAADYFGSADDVLASLAAQWEEYTTETRGFEPLTIAGFDAWLKGMYAMSLEDATSDIPVPEDVDRYVVLLHPDGHAAVLTQMDETLIIRDAVDAYDVQDELFPSWNAAAEEIRTGYLDSDEFLTVTLR